MSCPRCGAARAEAAAECAACGVVFAKAGRRPARVPPVILAPLDAPAAGDALPELLPLEPGVVKLQAAGLAVAVVVSAIPLLRFLLGYLGTLVHELGHAATSWMFGIPALPAFDFLHGGGITHSSGQRNLGLVAVVIGGFAWLAHRCRRFPRLLAVVAAAFGLWLALVLSGYDEMVVVAMGHGSELAFAGIFLYRAWSGAAVRVPGERMLYAVCGWFLAIQVVLLGAGIAFDPDVRAEYEEGKGGAWHFNDLNRLADDFLSPARDPGRVGVAAVAVAYLVAALAVPLAAWWVHRRFDRILALLGRFATAGARE